MHFNLETAIEPQITQINADAEEIRTEAGFTRWVRRRWLGKIFADSLLSAFIHVHLRFLGSMAKVPYSGEDHRHTPLVCRRNNLRVPH